MAPLRKVDLYSGRKGRPCLYDFSPFKNAKTTVIFIHCWPTEDVYNSIKSSFCRWRKKNNIAAGFVFDITDEGVTIWRRIQREKHATNL